MCNTRSAAAAHGLADEVGCCLAASRCAAVLRPVASTSYEVVKKSRKAADELAERLLQFVDGRGNVQCGIIYCLSR